MNSEDKFFAGIFGLVGLATLVQIAFWGAVIYGIVKLVQHFTGG